MSTLFTVLLLVAAGGWLLIAVVATLGHLHLEDLPADSGAADQPLPRLSVVVPARDEGDRLLGTVRALLDQRGVDLQLIVVDDRSLDPIAPQLAATMAADPRLQVVRVDAVPAGWLGKCHACHLGAQRATADWLLFMDADACCGPDVLARSLAVARDRDVDHLCLVPGLGPCTLVGKASVLMITLALLGLALGINRDLPFAYVGVGAFTLIRREVYDAIGGHQQLRLEVIEDLAMGYRVRRQGRRSRLFAALREFEVRWAHSAGSFVQVLEKNLFAKFGFRVWRAVVYVLVVLAAWLLPLLGLFAGTSAGLAAAAGMGLATVPAMWMARRHGWSVLGGLLAPLSLPLLAFATLRSTYCVLRQGGIRWRDTFYPLAELRDGAARID